jgi:hypothetical protein
LPELIELEEVTEEDEFDLQTDDLNLEVLFHQPAEQMA